MGVFTVQSLLRAVRRRLWRANFVTAARLALWGSAVLMLLAVAVVQVGTQPVGIDHLAATIAVLWALTLGWAALRRPSEVDCALWADRYLGGASAYSTLLEMRNSTGIAQSTQAVRWLEQWASASVPEARRLLAGRRVPGRLVRPLLSMLVSAALVALVLTLPRLAPPLRVDLSAPAASGAADHATPDAVPLASTQLASELAIALQSAGSRNMPDRGNVRPASDTGPSKSDDRTGSPVGEGHRTPSPGEAVGGTKSLPGNAVNRSPTGPRIAAPGAGSGRDAGDSRDDRADAAVSRALPGTMSVQHREGTSRTRTTERQADMGQLATFDDNLAMHPAGRERAGPVPAAATPPRAEMATRLTPTQAAYVQAWMKTNTER